MDERQREEDREMRRQRRKEELRQRRENMQRRSDSQAAAGFDVIRRGDDSTDEHPESAARPDTALDDRGSGK